MGFEVGGWLSCYNARVLVMLNPYRRCFLFIVLGVLGACQVGLLDAQLTRGFVSGTVSDPSDAVIVGAVVRIVNGSTNEEREAKTNQVGVYRFVALEPGSYTIEFSAPGFEGKRLENIVVGPAQEVVLHETLAVVGQTLSIEVREFVPVAGLARATPTVERTLDGSFAQSVPLTAATRDAARLALLTPTVIRAPGSSEISANGQRVRHNNFLLDGTDNNDLTVTGPNIRMIPEAVSEFQVQVTPYSVEYGRNTGAQVSIVTRRGGNTWNGELWDYYRANWMEPVSLLNKRAGLSETPRFVQNQVGGSLGGPIQRDRTFFFGLLEANRRREAPDARNAQPAIIPTPDGFDALSSIPLATDQSQQSRQAVLDALSLLPDVYKDIGTITIEKVPPQTINDRSIDMGSILIPLSRPQDLWYALGRIDHKLTQKDSIGYRYLLDKNFQANSTGNRQFGDRFAAASDILNQNHALNVSHVFTPNLINEFRFAYARNNLAFPEQDPDSPTVQISGAFTIGGLSNFPQGRIANTFQWQNITTYQKGRHSLKFGVDIRRNRLFNLAASDSKGTWNFANLSFFLNNRASRLRQAVTSSSYDARQTNQNYFFQDDFRVTKNLIVNFGLRYEYSGVPFDFFGAATEEIARSGVPLPAKPDGNNWSPRFGFAYSPSPSQGWKRRLLGEQRTVIRAGFGVAYDVLFYNILTVTAGNYPRVLKSDTDFPDTINLFPTLAPKQTAIPSFNPLLSFVNTPTDIQNPTTNFWNFSVQRQLGNYSLLEVGYIGNRSYHLLRQGERNPGTLTEERAQDVIEGKVSPNLPQPRLDPDWGSRATIESTALGEYHSLFVRFDRKMAKGLLAGLNYTWSANFSDNDEPFPVADIVLSSPQVPQDFFNYRPEWSRSVFDRPHRLAIYYVFEIPWRESFGRARGLLNQIFSGWQIAGFSEWQTGQPFTVRTGVDSGGSRVPGIVSGWRPDYNPAGILLKDPVEGNLRTFTAEGIFVTPLTPGGANFPNTMPHGGNLGRNTFRGPGFANWNFSLAKAFSLAERAKLRFRVDWFNVWNQRNFGNPVATMISPNFGSNTTDPGARTMLVSAKILF